MPHRRPTSEGPDPSAEVPSSPREPTRDRILQTALDVFAERGYEGTTTREICGRAGVNIAALNYHWRSKDRLWQAVLEECGRSIARSVAGVDFTRDPAGVLGELVDRFCDLYLAEPRFARLLAWNALQAKSFDYEASARTFRPIVEIAHGFVKKQQDAGRIPRNVDVAVAVPLVQAILIYTFVNRAGLSRWFGKDFDDPAHAERFRREIKRATLVLFGLSPSPVEQAAADAKAARPSAPKEAARADKRAAPRR